MEQQIYPIIPIDIVDIIPYIEGHTLMPDRIGS